MEEKTKYFVLKKKAVPEVLLKVVKAKKLLESGRAESVQEATELVGISRSLMNKSSFPSMTLSTFPVSALVLWSFTMV